MAAVRASSLPSEKSVATRISLIGRLMGLEIATLQPPDQPRSRALPAGEAAPGARAADGLGPGARVARNDPRAGRRSTGRVWNDDLERGPAIGGFERDGPPVRLDDPPAERQAEPAPLRLGGEECLE